MTMYLHLHFDIFSVVKIWCVDSFCNTTSSCFGPSQKEPIQIVMLDLRYHIDSWYIFHQLFPVSVLRQGWKWSQSAACSTRDGQCVRAHLVPGVVVRCFTVAGPAAVPMPHILLQLAKPNCTEVLPVPARNSQTVWE